MRRSALLWHQTIVASLAGDDRLLHLAIAFMAGGVVGLGLALA
jgi:hypothetical protein